jgi:peptidoglycan hydrolase CwlO-like protein
MELDELKQKRDDTLDMLDSQLDKEKRSFESRLLKEVELAKLSAAEEYTIQFEQKMRLAQENHKSEIQEILAAHELEKSKIKSSFQQEQIEAQTRLEMAEQALVDSKQQFFMEREKYQEKIDALQRDIDDFKSRSKSTSEEWNSKRAEFQVIIDRLNDDLDSMQSKISETNKKLELKSREVLEIQGLHEIELKSLKQEYQAQISALENQIKETDALVKGAQSKNGQTAEQLQEAKQEIEKLKADIEAQKLKTAKDVQKSQDALDDATDQLSRVQRVLKEVNSDVERYRKLADERDNEVLTLKRTVSLINLVATKGKGVDRGSNVEYF